MYNSLNKKSKAHVDKLKKEIKWLKEALDKAARVQQAILHVIDKKLAKILFEANNRARITAAVEREVMRLAEVTSLDETSQLVLLALLRDKLRNVYASHRLKQDVTTILDRVVVEWSIQAGLIKKEALQRLKRAYGEIVPERPADKVSLRKVNAKPKKKKKTTSDTAATKTTATASNVVKPTTASQQVAQAAVIAFAKKLSGADVDPEVALKSFAARTVRNHVMGVKKRKSRNDDDDDIDVDDNDDEIAADTGDRTDLANNTPLVGDSVFDDDDNSGECLNAIRYGGSVGSFVSSSTASTSRYASDLSPRARYGFEGGAGNDDDWRGDDDGDGSM